MATANHRADVPTRALSKDMQAIDAALATHPQMSTADMEEVRKLRTEGEVLHKGGKHPESEAALAKAMQLLGIRSGLRVDTDGPPSGGPSHWRGAADTRAEGCASPPARAPGGS